MTVQDERIGAVDVTGGTGSPGLKVREDAANWDSPVAVEAKEFDFYYGDFQALKGISIPVYQNQITAMIGPSGCGKSTFLRSINRMNDLIDGTRHGGKITFHGQDVYAPDVDPYELRRRIGMVFQRPNPFDKSIYENVAFGPRLHGMAGSKGDLDALVEKCLTGAALWNEVKDKLKQSGLSLSGGQQQRLCIARALATQPEVILMDEPCSALDPISTEKIEQLMLELQKDYTIVIVTHNMQQAARVSDKTAFFLKGVIAEFGPTKQIFTAPRNTETADYIQGRFG